MKEKKGIRSKLSTSRSPRFFSPPRSSRDLHGPPMTDVFPRLGVKTSEERKRQTSSSRVLSDPEETPKEKEEEGAKKESCEFVIPPQCSACNQAVLFLRVAEETRKCQGKERRSNAERGRKKKLSQALVRSPSPGPKTKKKKKRTAVVRPSRLSCHLSTRLVLRHADSCTYTDIRIYRDTRTLHTSTYALHVSTLILYILTYIPMYACT